MKQEDTVGEIVWHDLTVGKAESTAEFYQAVVGWEKQAVSMGDYHDFNMVCPASKEPTAGVCYAKGENADIPPQWMMYVRVHDVAQSVAKVGELGGRVLKGPTTFSGDTYYLIQDPNGAVLTIFSK